MLLASAGGAAAQASGANVFRRAGVEVTLPVGFSQPVKVPSNDDDSIYAMTGPNGERLAIIVSEGNDMPAPDISERRQVALDEGSDGEMLRFSLAHRGVRVEEHPTLSVPQSPEYATKGFVFSSPVPQLGGRYQTYVPRTGPVRVVTLRLTRATPGDPLTDLTVGGLFGSVRFVDQGAALRSFAVAGEGVAVVLPAGFSAFQAPSQVEPWFTHKYVASDGTHSVAVATVDLPGSFPTLRDRRVALDSIKRRLETNMGASAIPSLGDTPTHLTADHLFAFPAAPGSRRLRFASIRTFVPRTGPLHAVVVAVVKNDSPEKYEPDPVAESILSSVDFTAPPSGAPNPAPASTPTVPAPAAPPER